MIGKDVKSNNLYVSNNLTLVNAPRLSFRVHQINWINGIPTALMNNNNKKKKDSMHINKKKMNNNDNDNNDDDEYDGNNDHHDNDEMNDIDKRSRGMMLSLKLRHGPTFVKGLLVVDSDVNNNNNNNNNSNNNQDDNDMIIKIYLLDKDKGE